MVLLSFILVLDCFFNFLFKVSPNSIGLKLNQISFNYFNNVLFATAGASSKAV